MKIMSEIDLCGLHDGERLVRSLPWAPDCTEVIVPDRAWDMLVNISAQYPALRFDRPNTKLEVCSAAKWYPIIPAGKSGSRHGLFVNGDCVVQVRFVCEGLESDR